MLLLLLFTFLSGIVTILSPCIWPLLPILLSTSVSGGKRKPLGIIFGLMMSFLFFTLFLSYTLQLVSFDPDILRKLATIIIGCFGLILLVPTLGRYFEKWMSVVSRVGKNLSFPAGEGLKRGMFTGLILGVVWAPCAGPVLGTVAALSATQSVGGVALLMAFSFILGLGIPLFLFTLIGQRVLTHTKILSPYTVRIQQLFGVLMIFAAFSLYQGKSFTPLPDAINYCSADGSYLNPFESSSIVTEALEKLRQ